MIALQFMKHNTRAGAGLSTPRGRIRPVPGSKPRRRKPVGLPAHPPEPVTGGCSTAVPWPRLSSRTWRKGRRYICCTRSIFSPLASPGDHQMGRPEAATAHRNRAPASEAI